MNGWIFAVVVVVILLVVYISMAVRVFKQYERGVQLRLGRLVDGPRGPGLVLVIPFIDRVHRVSLRIVTMPIQSQEIITRDNVTVDVSAVAYYRVVDPVQAVLAIEDVESAIGYIAQATLRAVIGQHTLDDALTGTEALNKHVRDILDVQTEPWGVLVTLVELKNIQLPVEMKRAMAKEAEAEREKRAKIISANGEALAAAELAKASDVMMRHPVALQLRNLQTLVEISVDKNSTIIFPAPLMSAITDLVSFLTRESVTTDQIPTPDAEIETPTTGAPPGP
jgi:regulator of protease activity HflC (stomatin/prohibitin superfamily)